MNDDFNSPILIAQLFEAVKIIHRLHEKSETLSAADLQSLKDTLNDFLFDVLGLENIVETDNGNKLQKVVELLIAIRNEARANRDFATSDHIRDALKEAGIILKDGKETTEFVLEG